MPNEQPQTISVASIAISPVQRSPLVDTLLVTPDRSAQINYVLGRRVSGKAAVPGVPEVPAIPGIVGRGMILDGTGKVVTPAVEGRPAVPAVPAVPEIPAGPDSLIAVESGSMYMTDDEWNAWKDQDDNDYRFNIVAARLGLTLLQ